MSATPQIQYGRLIKKDGVEVRRMRPAYRKYMRECLMVVGGAVLAMLPLWTLRQVLAPFDALSFLTEMDKGMITLVGQSVQGSGLVLFGFGLFVITYGRLANRFFISSNTVAKEFGIIAKKRNQITLSHIRVVDIKQSLIERLLGIGRLEFSTAGTAGVDVVWHGIPNPSQAQQAIQSVISNSEKEAAD